MVDMTTGNPSKLIFKFALPMILGNIFQQVYNLVDTIVVGKFVGAHALAAIGSSFSIVVFITSIIIGLAMGANVILAQFYGSNVKDKFKIVSITSFLFIGAVTLVLMILSLNSIDFLLTIFNMPEELIMDSKAYLIIILSGLGFTFIYNLATAMLRSVGDSKRPLYFLIISSIINVILDLVFVINFNLGVKGVALATIIAQGISALLSCIYVYTKLSFIRFTKKDLKLDKDILKLVAKYSILTSIQQSIMNFGILIVQGLVNTFGVTVMAAFAAGVKVDSIAYMPVQDFGNAFSTYVAQNKGAEKFERIKKGIISSVKMIITFCLVTSSLILVFSKNIMLLFVDEKEEEIIKLGVQYISVVAVFYVLIGFLFMFYGLYRGLGMLKISIILTVISLGTRVGLAYVLSATLLGACGIWWSIPIGWALADALGVIVYKKLKY
ncbi:MATE family efflux transporter [Clostridium botulinum]|uniref:MATE family efflux transporter n=1 Tax=unclassified Clostridium TaxID=2614128 RepID=UPI000506A99D|nr:MULTISPECIES: MATE family efflux transporter [unclassified Clostridium]KFX54530.1 multidrug transporter MatE [Clostridium botulinum]MBY6778348.1 MATE family efflux transporter [Clostridium botulinum]MBY6850665.1 MATE family efflux transporter [Clostridium botulinum]MBY7007008.1 MATE family efflux transporter [Clostridium botulinum]NFF23433.1 MATE family efflux transporter [Clostridium botulinum]